MTKRIDPNNITEFGIRIVMDEEKIIKEDKYNLETIYEDIDEIARFAKMKKVDKYYYVSINDTPSALGCFIFANLKRRNWFRENVKDVVWYDKDDGIHNILARITETIQ